MIINQNINARIIFINTYKKLVIKKTEYKKEKKMRPRVVGLVSQA